MLDSERFDRIKRRHGAYGSWAIWAPPSGSPKSNMGDLEVLNAQANPSLLGTLNPGVVMVGLNISRSFADEPFRNFHDARTVANDFKIRCAFRGTPYWGAYMTDVIKGFVEPASGNLLNHLKSHPEIVGEHIERLRQELRDLGHPRPLILAFGVATFSLLHSRLDTGEYSLLVSITHYSHRISKEQYRDQVHQQILRAHDATA